MDDDRTPAGGEPAKDDRAPEEGTGNWLARNRQMLQQWVIFVGILGLMVAIDQWFFIWINTTLAERTADVTVWILQVLGVRSVAQGAFVWSTICFFDIIGECTAYYPCAIYLAAVLAFPTSWSRKGLGLLLGLPLVLAINQFRLVSLCYIMHWIPQHFETLHMIVWQALIIVITVVLWLVWATTLGSPDETPAA